MKLTLALGLVALLAGCYTEPYRVSRTVTTPGGLTSEEIVRMSKSGLSDAVIVEKIQSEGVSARPTAEQIESLKREGVSDAVVQAMIAARVEVPKETRYVYDSPYGYYPYSYPYYGYYGGGPYWYGGYYYPYGSYWYGGHPYYWGGHYYHSYPRGGYSVSHYRH